MKDLRKQIGIGLVLLVVMLFQACGGAEDDSSEQDGALVPEVEEKVAWGEDELREDEARELPDMAEFDRDAKEWGEQVSGVKTRINTSEQKIALTFDACGGPYGNGYDAALISYLREADVPATLFINERWIIEHETLFLELANDPLFQIENHGTEHIPLSVNGGTAWGIAATESPEEVVQEVLGNHDTVKHLTGKEMNLFRSGTAFYDEVAVELVQALGYQVVNFDVLGDAGATYSSEQVERALLGSESGSIALLHMNQPTSGTAAGVKAAVPKLREQGYQFVRLDGEELE